MAQSLELVLVEEAGDSPVSDAAVKVESHDFSTATTSNAQGLASIQTPDDCPHLAVRVRKTGFVPRLLVWDQRREANALPERFNLRMERSRTIGGIVRNSEGALVEGAKVLVSLRGAIQGSTGPRIENDIWEEPARTDAEGRWQFHDAPEDVKFIRVLLDHPDYASLEHIEHPPAPEEFKAGTAVLTLERGTPCEGIVTDAEDRPLANVRVIYGERGSGSPSKPQRKTDAEGKFRFGGLALRSYGMEKPILSFLKEGFSPELLELEITSSPLRPKVALQPGKSLRLKFVDANGTSVPGVTIAIHAWRGHRPFSLRFEADERGFLDWKDAPQDGVTFAIMHDKFQRKELVITATDEIQTIVLARPLVVTGRVIDARTEQPIPAFRVVRGRYFPDHPRQWADWRHDSPHFFTEGEYSCTFQGPVRMSNADHTPGEVGTHRLRVEADGYQPAISRPIANDEQDVRIDFALERGTITCGTVRSPSNLPLSGATLIIAGPGNPVFIRNGEAHRRQHLIVTTDDRGRYELPPQEEDFPVAIVHAKTGYLLTTCHSLAESPDVQLLRWGRLEILETMSPGGPPTHHIQPQLPLSESRIRFHSEPRPQAEGGLFYDWLCAGPWRVTMSFQPVAECPVVTILNGETTRLDLRTGRRAVTGRIAMPPEGLPTSRDLAHLRVRSLLPESAIPPGFDEEKRRQWLSIWGTAPEGANPRPEIRERPFEIDLEGHFRIDGLNFGHYRLIGIFHRTLVKPGDTEGELAGLLKHDFELVPGEGAFDLGTVPVQPGGSFKIKRTVLKPPRPDPPS